MVFGGLCEKMPALITIYRTISRMLAFVSYTMVRVGLGWG